MSTPIDGWLPGALSGRQIKCLCDAGWLENFGDENEIDGSSRDLTLTAEGFQMKSGAIKPFGALYEHTVLKSSFATPLNAENGVFTLKPTETYVFKIKQELGSMLRNGKKIYGQATAKSSIGRVDVLARLVVDGMDSYESFDPEGAHRGNGKLYLEITPLTFSIQVKAGISLSQLRLFYGSPDDCEMSGKELCGSVLFGRESDGCLTVDLSNAGIAPGLEGCAFKAKRDNHPGAIALWKVSPELRADPKKFWTLEKSYEQSGKTYFTVDRNSFHILRSKERICLPKGVAVYCRAIDETIGEMRIHYAGFVHPGFGYKRNDEEKGTPLIFEVRGHDVNVTLSDAEKMAKLIFYRLSEDAETKDSPYQKQVLKLSQFFGDWT
jgi:dCTP deaminase